MGKPKEKNKCVLGAEGFAAFCDQFGEDNSIYKRILLEVFFEELLNETNVLISGEERQEGIEDNILSEHGGRDTPNQTKQSEDA